MIREPLLVSVLLLALSAVLACHAGGEPTAHARHAQAQRDEGERPAGDSVSTPAEYTVEWLEELHGFSANHEPCLMDDECRSPLRCMDGQCSWPPAMLGQAERTSVEVTFQGASGEVSFALELAEGRREQARGLMHRRVMHPDFGMVFVFPREQYLSFWMENTLISLDMIFINSDDEIVTIVHSAEPLTRAARRSRAPARYVVELIAGTAARIGLEEGGEVAWRGLNVGSGASVED